MKAAERTRSAAGAADAFDRRAERAESLARSSKAAADPLRFAAGLLRVQARVARALEREQALRPFSGRLGDDLERSIEALRDVPRFAAARGPRSLAAEAAARAGEEARTAQSRLALFRGGARTSVEDYVSRGMLRPYLEVLRAHEIPPDRVAARGRCPFCGAAPAVGCRRGGVEGQGAGRFLVCGSCGLEWPFERILCPACFERDPVKLPGFTSATHPAVRLEACETCRRYVKSLDLSQDAGPLPEVDDLASLSLDLWAIERGYARVEPGLAGV